MTKQTKERAGWAAIVVTVLLAAFAVVAKGGALENRVTNLEAAVPQKADQKEVDALADGIRDANRRLLLIMGRQGIVDTGP